MAATALPCPGVTASSTCASMLPSLAPPRPGSAAPCSTATCSAATWLRPRPGRLPRYVSVRDLATCRATDPRRNRRIGMESWGRISWTGKGIGKNSREGNLSLARSQIFLSIVGPAFFFGNASHQRYDNHFYSPYFYLEVDKIVRSSIVR
jgi:hypothetical protein